MSWLSIVRAVVDSFVDGLVSTVSKPRFKYIGITGVDFNAPPPPFSSISTKALECSVRFEVTYHWGFGEGFVARNSRGWLAIYDNNGKRVHNSPGVWAWNYVVNVDMVSEESLILFHVYPKIGNPNDPALIVVPTPTAQLRAWLPYTSYQCLDYNNYLARNPQHQQQFSQICKVKTNRDFTLEARVASENAHGTRVKMSLGDVLSKCIKSYESGGGPVR